MATPTKSIILVLSVFFVFFPYAYAADTTAPVGTVIVNNNAVKTTSLSVTLNLSAKDASGVSQMQFSNDSIVWPAPEKYATKKSWNLLSLNGTKTVYVKFKDKAGNWSAVYSDTIKLDIPAPAAPTIDKVATPTKQNFRVISGKKTSAATQIIVTCPSASPEGVKTTSVTSWTCLINNLAEGANTVFVAATNAGGIKSAAVSATIVLDTKGPSINITSPKDGEVIR